MRSCGAQLCTLTAIVVQYSAVRMVRLRKTDSCSLFVQRRCGWTTPNKELKQEADMGSLWSLLFGRRITVNSESYQVVRRIGEGGECYTHSNHDLSPRLSPLGFSYVYLVRDRNGRQLALVSVLILCCH